MTGVKSRANPARSDRMLRPQLLDYLIGLLHNTLSYFWASSFQVGYSQVHNFPITTYSIQNMVNPVLEKEQPMQCYR